MSLTQDYSICQSLLRMEHPLKALVVGPGYHGYNESIARGFRELGMEAKSLPFEESTLLKHHERIITSSQVRFHCNLADAALGTTKELVKRTVLKDGTLGPDTPTLRRFGARIQKEIEINGFDLLLVIKGTVILPETLLRIRKSYPQARLVLWQQDSMVRYPMVLKGARYYDDVYVCEPMDLPSLKDYGVSGSVLPSCFDPTIYKPIFRNGKREFKRDIAFVGEGRPERFVFFKSLAKGLSSIRRETRIGIFGERWKSFLEDMLNFGISGITWEIEPADLHPTEVNRIYNESRICLNIHHAQAKAGLNLRTFEIPGSQSLELVDRKSSLGEYFEEGRELIAFGPDDRLHGIIASLLDDTELIESVALRGHRRAVKDHTYACRIRKLVDRL